MLRITTFHEPGSATVFKLEGKLLEPWVEELHEACRKMPENSHRAILDLSGISYVDLAGSIALRNLNRGGMILRGCSPLVTALLRENIDTPRPDI